MITFDDKGKGGTIIVEKMMTSYITSPLVVQAYSIQGLKKKQGPNKGAPKIALGKKKGDLNKKKQGSARAAFFLEKKMAENERLVSEITEFGIKKCKKQPL